LVLQLRIDWWDFSFSKLVVVISKISDFYFFILITPGELGYHPSVQNELLPVVGKTSAGYVGHTVRVFNANRDGRSRLDVHRPQVIKKIKKPTCLVCL